MTHFKLLDGLRGLAAQPVLLSHSFALVFPAAAGGAPIVIGWLARLSVILFFVLSGFVIAASIAGEIGQTRRFNWIEYAIRRGARIYPPYLVAIGFVALLMLFAGGPDRNLNVGAWAWLRALPFLFTGTDAITIAPVWSLRLEVGLYVFAALVALIFLARGRFRVILVGGTAALFAVYCSRLAFGGVAGALFAAGALAAIFFDRLMTIRPLLIFVFAGLALALPLIWPMLIDDFVVSFIYQGLLGIPLALALVALAHIKTAGQSRIARLVLASGGWSYTLYIIHVPIVIALTRAIPFGPGIGQQLGMLAACLLIANLIAAVIARGVERPKYFANLLRSIVVRREVRAAKAEPTIVG